MASTKLQTAVLRIIEDCGPMRFNELVSCTRVADEWSGRTERQRGYSIRSVLRRLRRDGLVDRLGPIPYQYATKQLRLL